MNCLCHVHPNVRDWILSHRSQDWEEHPLNDVRIQDRSQSSHTEKWGESMEVAHLYMERQEFRNGMLGGPLDTENLSQRLQIVD